MEDLDTNINQCIRWDRCWFSNEKVRGRTEGIRIDIWLTTVRYITKLDLVVQR